MVGGATCGLVGLGLIRKQAEQAMGSESVSGMSAWSLHQLLAPGWIPVPTSCSTEQ